MKKAKKFIFFFAVLFSSNMMMKMMLDLPAAIVAITLLFTLSALCSAERIKLGGTPPDPVLLAEVECLTTVDPTKAIHIEVYRNWSPIGAIRFVELVKDGYYDNSPVFRVVKVRERET